MSEALARLFEAFVPETIDRRGYLYDDPTFGYPTAVNPFTSLSDRAEGRYRPYYDTEIDLAYIRGAARNLGLLTPVAQAALDRLAEYTFGPGFVFTAQSQDTALADLCQRIIDRFCDSHDMTGTLDRELHHRSREDGEAFAYLEPGLTGAPTLCVLEPDQIREPGNVRQLEDWLDDYDGPTSWTFGIRTPERRPDMALGYHVTRDDGGMDWDYVPERRMLHISRGSPRNAKRGVSDLFLIVEEIAREAKLRRNMAEGAALQAAIAWILEAPPGTSQASIQTLGAGDAVAQYGKQILGGGQKPQRVQKYQPGTILKPSPGLVYKPGPMGAERNDGFLAVSQQLLRIVGVRWAMPEYMVSGDASNANYASTLVAESPFVKAREADQSFYARAFEGLLWKVLRFEWERGILPQRPWAEIEALLEITTEKPSVASRNPQELANVQAIQIQNGLLSKRTAATQAGLDWEQEQQNRAEEAPPPAPATPVLSTSVDKMMENCGTGDGGFKPGNTCGSGGGGGVDTSDLKPGIKISGPKYHFGVGELSTQPANSGGWTFIAQDINYARNFKGGRKGRGVAVKADLKNVIDISHIPGDQDIPASRVSKALAKYGIDIDPSEMGEGEIHQVLEPVRAKIKAQALKLGYDGLHQEENFAGQLAKTTAVFEPEKTLKHIQRNIESVQEAEDSYDAPEAARNNARKVLKWRDEHGDAVAGMTQVGWTRANQLASGERLSRETVGRMAAFARHRKNDEVAPEYKSEPWRDAGHVAWLGWGGTTGVDWAAGIVGNVSESCDCSDCGSVETAGTLQAAIVAALESVSTLPEARAILEGLQQ